MHWLRRSQPNFKLAGIDWRIKVTGQYNADETGPDLANIVRDYPNGPLRAGRPTWRPGGQAEGLNVAHGRVRGQRILPFFFAFVRRASERVRADRGLGQPDQGSGLGVRGRPESVRSVRAVSVSITTVTEQESCLQSRKHGQEYLSGHGSRPNAKRLRRSTKAQTGGLRTITLFTLRHATGGEWKSINKLCLSPQDED